MYARLTLLEIDTVRVSMDHALRHYQDVIVPMLHEQPGFSGVYVLSTPEGKGAVLSFWETEAQASTDVQAFYGEALGSFATFFRAPPGRERYEVVYCEEPKRAIVR